MASVFRRSYRRPLPEGAEVVTRRGERLARWKDRAGRTRTAPLADDGQIVLEYRCWYVEYGGADGRRVTVKGYTDREATEQLARDKERLAARIRAGLVEVDTDRAATPFPEALAAWLADLARRGKSKKHCYNMGLLVGKIGKACGWPTLGAVRSDTLSAWLAQRAAAGLAPRTTNYYLASARTFIRWCCRQAPPWLKGNPLDGVGRADVTTWVRQKRALTLEELDALRRASGKRWVVYLTAALTGLRRSELKRLLWGDVRLDATPPHLQLRRAATKAKRADTVPINGELLEALRAHRPEGARADQPVFRTVPSGTTYHQDTERAGIAWRDAQGRLASFHCLRKTFCTYLALADVPIRVAMDLMRVTDAKLLTDTYTDAKLFNTSAAAARLPRLHRPDGEGQDEATAG
jgi:integrase